MHKTGTS